MSNWLFLIIAIFGEILATSALKASDGFSKLIPSTIAVVGYMVSFYFLSLTLRTIPLGIAYAIWSGLGVVCVAAIAWLFYGQKLDMPAVIGMTLIVVGVVVMNVFSKSISH